MAEIDQLTQAGPFWNQFKKQWDDNIEDINRHMYGEVPKDSAGVKKGRKKPEQDDEKTVRRRDILVSISVLGELEQYVGEKIEPAKIRTMKKDKLDTLFAAYETKLGQEMTENGMETVVGTAVKAISYLLPIDDQEKLKEDLLENKPLRRSVGRHCAGVAERYGDLVAFAKVAYDVIKHIKTEEPPK